MNKPSVMMKKKAFFLLAAVTVVIIALFVRVVYIQFFEAEFLQARAFEQQTRDRLIAPERGAILDRNMVGMAKTETVSSVSVIHNQIKEPERVATVLAEKLELDYAGVLEKISKKVALMRIKTKVDKDIADEIRNMDLKGVVVDEDIRRVYPFSSMASQVIGFVGKDNQGIVGLEAKYDSELKGEAGKILTETDVAGRELTGAKEYRVPPVPGNNLITSLDVTIQRFAEQTIEKVVEAKGAKRGAIILMNPQNGEIYALANKPDFDLNDPFTINNPTLMAAWDDFTDKQKNDYLNQMWRNFSINDTYEPGSTFKIITSAAGLEEKVVTPTSTFSCSGFSVVGGRQIKCWRYPRSHGGETFVEGVQNSCNPVFMAVAERLGATKFYEYLKKFGITEKTGIDLPGEAIGIMHKLEKVGPVELATMSFGQSFQITPLQLVRMAAATVNGGYLVTPHIGTAIADSDGNIIKTLEYGENRQVISAETSEVMKEILESVVYAGTGNKTYIPGYRVGGKTATSEKLPRRSGKYIASFLAFAPAENPTVIALVLIDEPQGVYYGGQVAGPVMKELFENVLPYLNVTQEFSQDEMKLPEAASAEVPDVKNHKLNEAAKLLFDSGLSYETVGEGSYVVNQFPIAGEVIRKGENIIIYLGDLPQ